jgi:hypothetical protein
MTRPEADHLRQVETGLTVLEFFPVFCALGIAALSGERLAEDQWKPQLQMLASVFFLIALIIILIFAGRTG